MVCHETFVMAILSYVMRCLSYSCLVDQDESVLWWDSNTLDVSDSGLEVPVLEALDVWKFKDVLGQKVLSLG